MLLAQVTAKHTGVVALLEAAGRTNNAESDGDGGELAQSK
jgi:hypothetical protein